MVCQWGMSEKLGPVTFRQGEPHPFLGREMAEQRDFSEETGLIIDEEIRKITGDMESKAQDILESNRDTLDKNRKRAFGIETLSKEDIDRILAQGHDSSFEERASN